METKNPARIGKVLLFNPKVEGIVEAPPLGLGYIAAGLKKHGYEVIFIDQVVKKIELDSIVKCIRDENITIVGMSMVTPSAAKVIQWAGLLKQYCPWVKIVVGGAHATLLGREIINNNVCIDFVVVGEGEDIMPLICESIDNPQILEQAHGLFYRKGGTIVENKGVNRIEDIDRYPFPLREVFDMKKYSQRMLSEEKPVTSLLTSRGCPYQCIYCSKPVSGSRVRKRTVSSVVNELQAIIEGYGIKEVVFYDDVFTIDKKRIHELCALMCERKLKLKWKCETRVDLVDRQMLVHMKQAGCYLIGYGIESGSEPILNFLRKGVTLAQIRHAVRLTREVGMQVLGYFMIGIPTETEEDIMRTIKFSKQLQLDFSQFSIATAYPGSELFSLCQEKGMSFSHDALAYSMRGQRSMVSLCAVSEKRLQYLLRKAYKEFYFRPAYIMERVADPGRLKFTIQGFRRLLQCLG